MDRNLTREATAQNMRGAQNCILELTIRTATELMHIPLLSANINIAYHFLIPREEPKQSARAESV